MPLDPTPPPAAPPLNKPVPEPSFSHFTVWLWAVAVPLVFILPKFAMKMLPRVDGHPPALRTAIMVISVPLQLITLVAILIWLFIFLRGIFQPPLAAASRDAPPFMHRLGVYRRPSVRVRRWLLASLVVGIFVGFSDKLAGLPSWARLTLALVAIAVMVLIQWQTARISREESDELEMRVQHGAANFALSALCAVLCGFYFFDLLDILPGFRWSFHQLLLLIVALYLLGSIITSRRYR